MKLPKRTLPQYTATLEASGVDVKYRPHTVREEQILNMAQMSDNEKDKIDAVFQIVENCVDYDIEKLFPAEIELLFMKIRATSDTPHIPIVYTVTPELDEDGNNIHANCEEELKSTFDINKDIKIEFEEDEMLKYGKRNKDGSWLIDIGEGVSIAVRIKPIADINDDVLYELVEYIVDEEPEDPDSEGIAYKDLDYNKEEFMEWINEMPSSAFQNFTKFVEHTPKCTAHIKFECTCGQVIEESESGILRFLV